MPDAVALSLQDDQQVVGHVAEVDDQGNAVDAAPANLAAVSSDETIATATVDGADVTISSVGPTGTATVSLAADGADGTPGALTLDVNVAIGTSAPVAMGVTFGDPTPRA